jgi:hypothetical protein
MFARGNTPFKDERLRSAADAAVQRAYDDVAGSRRSEGFTAYLSAAGCSHPEGSGVLLHKPTF